MPGFNISPGGLAGDPAPNLETSRRNRWILEVLGPLATEILVCAHKAGRPTVEMARLVMHHGQDEIYMPGKQTWSPIEISFYEIHNAGGTDFTAKSIYKWWSEGVVVAKKSKIATNFKKDAKLYLLNGSNQRVWAYNIYGAWPSKISPDSLDYSDSAISEITIVLQMDKAEEIEQNATPDVWADPCKPKPASVPKPPAQPPAKPPVDMPTVTATPATPPSSPSSGPSSPPSISPSLLPLP